MSRGIRVCRPGRVRVLAAANPACIAIWDGTSFFQRTYGELDMLIETAGQNPNVFLAELLTKWEFVPVVGKDGRRCPTIGLGQFPSFGAHVMPDGIHGLRIISLMKQPDAWGQQSDPTSHPGSQGSGYGGYGGDGSQGCLTPEEEAWLNECQARRHAEEAASNDANTMNPEQQGARPHGRRPRP